MADVLDLWNSTKHLGLHNSEIIHVSLQCYYWLIPHHEKKNQIFEDSTIT